MPRWEEMRPILVAAYELMDDTPDGMVNPRDLADRVGRQWDDVVWERDLYTLAEDDYLDVLLRYDPEFPGAVRGTPKGRQEVQGWPGARTDVASAELLLELLERAASSEDTPETERGRLRSIVAAIREATIETVAKAVGETVARGGGFA